MDQASGSAKTIAELQRTARAARVFLSMSCLEGLTPALLGHEAHSEPYPTHEPLPRRHGIFRACEVGLPVFDRGSLYGDAVFEGVLVSQRRLFLWREHLERLRASARQLDIAVPYDLVDLSVQVLKAVAGTGLDGDERGYVRLVVSRGLGDLGIHPRTCVGSTVYAIAARIQLYPEETYRRGIRLSVARRVRRPGPEILDPRVKSCNYLNNILALLDTASKGCPETVMLNRDGYVSEATADNLFLVLREGGWQSDPSRVRIVTPSGAYCLNGITRALVLGFAAELGYRTEETAHMLPADLVGPDREVFLTGTGAGLVPAVSVAGQPVGDGRPGPITETLRDRLVSALADPALGLPVGATAAEVRRYLEGPPSPGIAEAAHSWREVSMPEVSARFDVTGVSLPDATGFVGPEPEWPASDDVVQKLFARVDGRDWEGLRDVFCEDVVYERPGYPPFVGIERLLRFYRDERVIASGEHHLDSVVVCGSRGACWGRFTGRHRNGTGIDEGFADVYTFENGKIKRRKSYFYRPAV